jgi:hypothetical protein
MDRKNNSEGTGEHGIGNGKDHGMGNGLGDGIGVGNENAVQTVRSWQFLPAKDAGQHPVALWIKVETMFRLF